MKKKDDHDLWRAADHLLDELLTLAPEERLAALEQREVQPEVADRVRRLLAAGAASQGPLDRPAEELLEGAGGIAAEGLIGRRIGPFELVEKLGAGGMSVVFRAKRVDGAFEQEVALKILTLAHQASSDRIRQEKEILARLRHSHISTVIDGGVTEDGTPWLAMELVEGDLIDQHCERQDLDARSVVKLFLQVCDAVAYAHRNLVVHRDLKPGNIMVDPQGQARLLDFGIAKLLDEVDQEATHTRVFTPRYAAPEQLTGEAVTTATDVYGMGAVLYRLLARSTAPATGSGDSTGPDTVAPLTRPSRSEQAVAGIDRDLDTVVLRAMRHEAEQRYPSAGELREDLARWLARRPVKAVPPSFAYRIRKLVQRQRAAVLGAALVILAVAAGTATTWWQAGRARAQAQVATREAERATAVTGFLVDLFELAEPDRSQGETLTVREALDVGARQLRSRLADQPEVRTELLGTVGDIYRQLGLYDEAAPVLEEAVSAASELAPAVFARARLRRALLKMRIYDLEAAEKDLQAILALDDPELRSEALQALGSVRRSQGEFVEANEYLEQALLIETSAAAPDLERIARARLALGDTAFEGSQLDRAGELYRQTLEELRAGQSGDTTRLATVLQSLAVHAFEAGDEAASLRYYEESLAIRERLLGEDHPDVAHTLRLLAGVHRSGGRLDEAEVLYRRAFEVFTGQLGDNHPEVLLTLNSLSVLAHDQGRTEEAVEILTEVVARSRITYGELHPFHAEFLINLAAMQRGLGQYDDPRAHLEEALGILRETKGEDNRDVGHVYIHLGNLERERGAFDTAEAYYKRALEVVRTAVGEKHTDTLSVLANLANVSFSLGRFDESVEQLEQSREIAEALLAEGHPLRAVVDMRLARSLLRVDRADEGLDHAERASAVLSEIYPDNHPRRLEMEAVLGAARFASGDTREGERLLRSVRDRLEAGSPAHKAAAEIVAHWLPIR